MKEPEFNHRKEILFDVTDELLTNFKAKTLTVEVYGKIEPKKNHHINNGADTSAVAYDAELQRQKSKVPDPRIKEQEEKIQRLLAEMRVIKEKTRNY